MPKPLKSLPPVGHVKIRETPANPLLDNLYRRAGIAESAHPNPTRWDDLDKLYNVMAHGIVEHANNINSMVRHLQANFIQNDMELNLTIVGLEKDLMALAGDMKTIRDGHKGRIGPVANAQELTSVMGIFNDYLVLKSRMEATIVPTFTLISERCGFLAGQMRKEAQKNNPPGTATDPNVIDV